MAPTCFSGTVQNHPSSIAEKKWILNVFMKGFVNKKMMSTPIPSEQRKRNYCQNIPTNPTTFFRGSALFFCQRHQMKTEVYSSPVHRIVSSKKFAHIPVPDPSLCSIRLTSRPSRSGCISTLFSSCHSRWSLIHVLIILSSCHRGWDTPQQASDRNWQRARAKTSEMTRVRGS